MSRSLFIPADQTGGRIMRAAAIFDVLVVGCGAIAGGYDAERGSDSLPLTHAAAFTRHGGFRLAGCIDPDAERRNAFARRWGGAEAFADIKAAAARPVDVVSICSPTSCHAEHVEAALELNPKLIFCEKPLTSELADARRLIEACDASGVLLAVNHTRRWAPDIISLRDALARKETGEIRAVSCTYNKGILNNGVHMVDLLQFLLGPVHLASTGAPLWDFWDDDPTVPALMKTEKGVSITLGIAHAADYALFEMTILTERATLTMEDGGARWRKRSVIDSKIFPGYRSLDQGIFYDGTYEEAMSGAIREIHQALSFGHPISSTGRSAVEAQALCSMIRDQALAGAAQPPK